MQSFRLFSLGHVGSHYGISMNAFSFMLSLVLLYLNRILEMSGNLAKVKERSGDLCNQGNLIVAFF